MKFGIVIFSIMIVFAAFLAFDAGCGRSRYFECEVSGHSYEPPWTETTSSTDSDGHVTFDTIHHSEVFHLICMESGGGRTFDCQSTRAQYTVKTNGQPVTVRTRQGHWTKHHWLPTVED